MKFQKPVIVYNYPKDIKAFYMRLNDDSKTVAAMDVLVPKVCRLIIHVYSFAVHELILISVFASLNMNKLIFILYFR